ncbi:MAG: nucleotide-binding universal stress UspA family protein, partial [Pirellulaceae bacterium]
PPVAFNMLDVRNGAAASLHDVASEIQKFPGKIDTHVLEGGKIDAEICDVAEKLDADLIVMGTHGRTGLAHVFLGSVAERTLRTAPCPVLTVKAPEGGSDR